MIINYIMSWSSLIGLFRSSPSEMKLKKNLEYAPLRVCLSRLKILIYKLVYNLLI